MTYIIAIYKSTFDSFGTQGGKFWHYAVHFEHDGKLTILEYGRYGGSNGTLRIREKKYPEEALVTAWQMKDGATPMKVVIEEMKAYCEGKTWGVASGTNCFATAAYICNKHGTAKNHILMGAAEFGLWSRTIEGVADAVIMKIYDALSDR